MKKIFPYLLLASLFSCVLYHKAEAQQDPMYTQYMNNILSVNPAYAGSGDVLSLMVMSRNQWVAFDGAPTTQTFVMHSPITKYHMGVGFSLLKINWGQFLRQEPIWTILTASTSPGNDIFRLD